MNTTSELTLDTLFSKYAKLQASLELVNDIRDPVVRNSPLLLAASQVRPTVYGFLSRVSDDEDKMQQLSAALDRAWDTLMPELHAYLERQRLLAFDPSSIERDCTHFQGILPLDEDGLLPQGMHHAAWSEFVARFGQTDRRHRQTQGLLMALLSLQNAGCKRAYVGGSFVTAKEDPTDVDYVFDGEGLDASKLEPMLDRNNFAAHRAARSYYGIDGGAGDIKYVRRHRQHRTIFQCDMINTDDPALAHLGHLPRSRSVGVIALDLSEPLPPATDFSPYGMWDDIATRMEMCGRF